MQNKCPACGGKLDTEFTCIQCGGRYPPEWLTGRKEILNPPVESEEEATEEE